MTNKMQITLISTVGVGILTVNVFMMDITKLEFLYYIFRNILPDKCLELQR